MSKAAVNSLKSHNINIPVKCEVYTDIDQSARSYGHDTFNSNQLSSTSDSNVSLSNVSEIGSLRRDAIFIRNFKEEPAWEDNEVPKQLKSPSIEGSKITFEENRKPETIELPCILTDQRFNSSEIKQENLTVDKDVNPLITYHAIASPVDQSNGGPEQKGRRKRTAQAKRFEYGAGSDSERAHICDSSKVVQKISTAPESVAAEWEHVTEETHTAIIKQEHCEDNVPNPNGAAVITNTSLLSEKGGVDKEKHILKKQTKNAENDTTIKTKRFEANDCEKRNYTCEECGKIFSKMSGLKSHRITHTGETPFKCFICEKGFNVRSNLNAHLRIHTGHKPHECNLCKKSFTQAGQLKQHMLIHRGEKPYTCNTCLRSFRNTSALVTHQRIHTGEKPFPCDQCSRSFTTSTSLKTHRVTHTGTMLFDCPVCGRQFNRRNNLNVHIKRHDKERSFTCSVCSNGFVMRAHLLNHMRNCHNVDIHDDALKYNHMIIEEEEEADGKVKTEERSSVI